MADMEVHEHVVVDGPVGKLRNPIVHHNVESISRYIFKHNEYSNWDAKVWLDGDKDSVALRPHYAGARRNAGAGYAMRFSRCRLRRYFSFSTSTFARLGFLVGVPGLLYCLFSGHPVFSHQG